MTFFFGLLGLFLVDINTLRRVAPFQSRPLTKSPQIYEVALILQARPIYKLVLYITHSHIPYQCGLCGHAISQDTL